MMASNDSDIAVRVLLSDDTVIHLHCHPKSQIEQINENLLSLPAVQDLKSLSNLRTSTVLLSSQFVQDSIQDGDILFASTIHKNKRQNPIIIKIAQKSSNKQEKIKLCSEKNIDLNGFGEKQVISEGKNEGTIEENQVIILEDTKELSNDNGSWRKAYLGKNENLTESLSSQRNFSCQDLLVHACLQSAESISFYQKELRTIYHAVRKFKNKGTCDVHQLLPRLHRMVAKDKMPFYLSAGISIVISGWLQINTSFWPHRGRKTWGVLWDCKLSLFKNEDYSRKYLLALSKHRRGTWSSVGDRMIEDYPPCSEYDISGYTAKIDNEATNTFVLLDFYGAKVAGFTCDGNLETSSWVDKICQESQHSLMMQKHKLQASSGKKFTSLLKENLKVPLYWLHLMIDKLDRHAKTRRVKCATLSQALKDIRRDKLIINGKVFLGAFIEDILSAVAVEIMRHASSETHSFNEMDALQFARRVLICSARTQGAGDIFEAVNLLLKNPHICVCPDSELMDPVEIIVCKPAGHTVVNVVTKAYYKLLSIEQGEECPNSEDAILGRLVGISNQQLVCQLQTVPVTKGYIELKLHE